MTVTFPEDYRAEGSAGKRSRIPCQAARREAKESSELDDDFAQDVSEFDTMEEYSGDVRAKALRPMEERREEATQNNVLEAVVGAAEIDCRNA